MRVLLVRPENNWKMRIVGPEIGLGVLASHLRAEGHQVAILDCIRDGVRTETAFMQQVSAFSPQLVGFKAFTMDVPFVKEASRWLKKAYPDCPVVVGGPYPSGDPQGLHQVLPDCDFGFVGEADIGFPQLVKKLEEERADHLSLSDLKEIPGLIAQKEGQVLQNPTGARKNLDEVMIPAWDLIDPRTYSPYRRAWGSGGPYTPIYFTRGCPYDCTFCAVKVINGKLMRRRSVENIVSELKLLYDHYGVRSLSVADDMWTIYKPHVLEVCEGILQSGLKFKWDFPNAVRIDSIDEEMLKLFERCGWVSISIAIETGSQEVIDHMKKKIQLEEAREKAELIKRVTNMELFGFFIMGYPKEDERALKATVSFALSLPLDHCLFFYFTPHPGTEIYRELAATMPEKFQNVDWASFHYDKPTFSPASVPLEVLKRHVQMGFIRFYARPRILWGMWSRRKNYQLNGLDFVRRAMRRASYTLSPS